MTYEITFSNDGLPFGIIIQQVTNIGSHWHNHLEFLLVLDGSIRVRARDKGYNLKKDDLFVINEKEIHSVSRTDKENIVLRLQIDLNHFLKYYPNLKDMVLKNDYFLLEENKERSVFYKNSIAKIFREGYKEKEGYKLRMGSEVALILSYIIERYASVNGSDKDIKNEDRKFIDIKNILNYIDNNFHEGINRDDIAEEFNFNKDYLSRFFKIMTGITMQDYFNHIRLDKASELLIQTNHSITIIAGDCGVESPRALNRLFNRYYNSTPSDYRKNYAEMDKEAAANTEEIRYYTQIYILEAIESIFEHLDH